MGMPRKNLTGPGATPFSASGTVPDPEASSETAARPGLAASEVLPGTTTSPCPEELSDPEFLFLAISNMDGVRIRASFISAISVSTDHNSLSRWTSLPDAGLPGKLADLCVPLYRGWTGELLLLDVGTCAILDSSGDGWTGKDLLDRAPSSILIVEANVDSGSICAISGSTPDASSYKFLSRTRLTICLVARSAAIILFVAVRAQLKSSSPVAEISLSEGAASTSSFSSGLNKANDESVAARSGQKVCESNARAVSAAGEASGGRNAGKGDNVRAVDDIDWVGASGLASCSSSEVRPSRFAELDLPFDLHCLMLCCQASNRLL